MATQSILHGNHRPNAALTSHQGCDVGGDLGILDLDRLRHAGQADTVASRAKIPDVTVAPTVEESETPVRQEQPARGLRPVHREAARQVDLNHATASDLQGLPGIGPKLAQRVIDHRTARGPFGKIEDLQQVKGIGRKKFDRLRPHVLVTNTRSLARHKGTL